MTTKKIPMRMCIGCREMKPKRELIRVVKTPEGEIKLDTTGKLNGRGAYVCPSKECLVKIRKINALAHNFKLPIENSIYDKLEAEFEKIEQQ